MAVCKSVPCLRVSLSLAILSLTTFVASAANAQSITITSPTAGATISGTATVSVSAVSVSSYNLYIDSGLVGSSPTSGAKTFLVDTTKFAPGWHSLSTIAFQGSNPTYAAMTSFAVAVARATASPTATATRTPSATATATRTATPVATPIVKTTATATPISSPTPALTYHVALTGSDTNGDGSAVKPWRTIQHAVNLAKPGWTIDVDGSNGSNYAENISITSAGTSTAGIIVQGVSGQPRVKHFTVSGSYWTVSNFNVSNQTAGDGTANAYGIYITSTASHVVIAGNYVHELCQEGIYETAGVRYVTLQNNRIWRAEMAGLSVDGMYGTIEGNEVWDTQQDPANAGGIYSVCSSRSSADADGMRFFGQHQLITNNYFHDVQVGSVTNPNPHTDCYQTWGWKDAGAPLVDDINIAGNRCRWAGWQSTSSGGSNHLCMIQGNSSYAVGTVRLYNNIFSNSLQGCIVGNNVGVIKFWLNTVDHVKQETVDFNTPRSNQDEVGDNIFYDSGNGSDSYASGSGMTLFDNDCIMRSGAACGTYPSNYSHLTLNPDFVNSGDSTGNGADYHLQNNSPLLGSGNTVSGVNVDFDDVTRPAGSYSVGAYQQ